MRLMIFSLLAASAQVMWKLKYTKRIYSIFSYSWNKNSEYFPSYFIYKQVYMNDDQDKKFSSFFWKKKKKNWIPIQMMHNTYFFFLKKIGFVSKL